MALVSSSLLGGWVASLTSTRLTYFLTVPFGALSLLALAAFREPRLHKADDTVTLRTHVSLTFRTILARGPIRPVVVTMALTSLLLQSVLEFGPLWMVALAVPAVLYGPHLAGLMSAVGLGGLLGGWLRFDRPATVVAVVTVLVGSSAVLVASREPALVIAAQIVLALHLVAASIFLTRLLNDCVPSNVRAGVASATGTLTWMALLPFALAFGIVSDGSGVHTAGWMMIGAAVVASGLLARLAWERGDRAPCPPPIVAATKPVAQPATNI